MTYYNNYLYVNKKNMEEKINKAIEDLKPPITSSNYGEMRKAWDILNNLLNEYASEENSPLLEEAFEVLFKKQIGLLST